MVKTDLKDEEKKLIIEALNNNIELPSELMTKLFPGLAEKFDSAEFIEGLRERLIYLREILSDDGSIYLHLDQKMSHSAKIVMDEVFGLNNFLNQITWQRTDPHNNVIKKTGYPLDASDHKI